jgi:uncharacterized protein (TIGR02246 family)
MMVESQGEPWRPSPALFPVFDVKIIGNLRSITRRDSMTADEQAIHEVVAQLETAWNGSDGNGFAAPFAEDANFIHIFGGQIDGRAAIEASHRNIFETIYKGSEATFLMRNIRFVRPDVAIVFARAHLKLSETNEIREMDARPTLIMVKNQGKWQIVALQNTKVSEMPAAARAASRHAS